MRSLYLLLFLLLAQSGYAQWMVPAHRYVPGWARSAQCKFNALGDSTIFAAFSISGMSYTNLIQLNSYTGLEEANIPLNGPPATPVATDVQFFSGVGYLVSYDSSGVPGFTSGRNKYLAFYSYADHSLLWDTKGSLTFPWNSYFGLGSVGSDGSIWLTNSFERSVYKIQAISGDTAFSYSYAALPSLWNLDSNATIGRFGLLGSRFRTDTLAVQLQVEFTKAPGQRVYRDYGFLIDTAFERISDTNTAYRLPFYESATLRMQVDSVEIDLSNLFVKKTIYERAYRSQALRQLLVVDSLSFQADTARIPPTRTGWVLQHGKYKAYFERYPMPSPSPDYDYEALRLRLYRNDSLQYERILKAGGAFLDYVDVVILQSHLFADGRVCISFKTDSWSPSYTSILMLIAADGSNFLGGEESGIDFEPTLDLFPTVAEEYLNLRASTEIEEVVVYGINGHLLLHQWPGKKELTLDVRNLSSGTYLIKLQTGAGVEFRRFFIR